MPPFLGETYLTTAGGGATLAVGEERVPVRVSDRRPERAVLGTGFPFRQKGDQPRYLRMFDRCLRRFEGLRRPGAGSLDLAWVASGVFEGFFGLGLSPWDVAAGSLLVEEAGGVFTTWDGGSDYLSGDILAGSPAVHAALLELTAAERLRRRAPARPLRA